MKNLNLPPFYIGQKVVYITGKNLPNNSIHTVTSIQQKDCGCWSILVNNQPPINKIYENAIYCCGDCRTVLEAPKTVGWFRASSFRALQEKPLLLLTFEKIKETEKEEILILN
jgi:hypothetical protein